MMEHRHVEEALNTSNPHLFRAQRHAPGNCAAGATAGYAAASAELLAWPLAYVRLDALVDRAADDGPFRHFFHRDDVLHDGRRNDALDRRNHALDLLKERFARGEINQAEYEERKRLLQV